MLKDEEGELLRFDDRACRLDHGLCLPVCLSRRWRLRDEIQPPLAGARKGSCRQTSRRLIDDVRATDVRTDEKKKKTRIRFHLKQADGSCISANVVWSGHAKHPRSWPAAQKKSGQDASMMQTNGMGECKRSKWSMRADLLN